MPLSDAAKAVRSRIAKCKRCPLSAHTKPVLWSGPTPLNPPAIAVIGEAPGEMEERTGRGFIGPSGQLLRRMMKDVGLDPERMGWLNSCMCRPKQTSIVNPDPPAASLKACGVNVNMSLAVLKPRFLLLVGRIALNQWRPGAKLQQAHGRPFITGDRRITIGVYHPAALLHAYNADIESKLRGDLRFLRELTEAAEPGELWPVDCESCGRDVEIYDEQAVAWCMKHAPQEEYTQEVLFSG